MVAKNNRIAGMFSPEEKEGILKRAQAVGMSLNRYVRFILLNAELEIKAKTRN